MTCLIFLMALAQTQHLPTSPHPWEDEVVYQVFPRSYRDSNGDRIGDMKGIIEGLPTIQKLGCTAILINPVYKSRVYHNYFADDWFAIDPSMGTMADFKAMVKAAHRRKIKVLLDTEAQYIADKSRWFEAAVKNPRSPERDYLWVEDPKVKGLPGPMPEIWYNHARVGFTAVNLDNHAVRAEILRHYEFWAATGLDGFRLDHTCDDLDFKGVHTHLLENLWDPIVKVLRAKHPGMFFIAEQADWRSAKDVLQILDQTKIDATFAFRFRDAMLSFNKVLLERALSDEERLLSGGKTEFTFLENHDLPRFASLEPDPARRRLAAALLLLSKGTPSIYYGQELGMRGRQGRWNCDGNDIPVRLAYRWGSTLSAKGTATWYAGTGPWAETGASANHDGISLEEQVDDPRSLFNLYRTLIAVRRASPALSHGDQRVISMTNPSILCFAREFGNQKATIFANLSEGPQGIELPAGGKVRTLVGSMRTAGKEHTLAAWSLAIVEQP